MPSARVLLNGKILIAATVAVIATTPTSTLVAQDGKISACVNEHSGEIKIAVRGSCPPDQFLLQWNQTGVPGPAGPAGPSGPPGPAGVANVYYISEGMFPGTSVARAFCPQGTRVTGGGGISINQRGLQQSHPIADEGGLIAVGANTAIGWQVAADDFSPVQAFVVCVGP